MLLPGTAVAESAAETAGTTLSAACTCAAAWCATCDSVPTEHRVAVTVN